MPNARHYFPSVVAGGLVYALGGAQNANVPSTQYGSMAIRGLTECDHAAYNPATNTWASIAPMPEWHAHVDGAAVELAGIIYVFGGTNYAIFGLTPYGTELTDAYNIATNTWTSVALMPQPRIGLAVVAVRGHGKGVPDRIIVFGGYSDYISYNTWSDVVAYTPSTDTWAVLVAPVTVNGTPLLGIGSTLVPVTMVSTTLFLVDAAAHTLHAIDYAANTSTAGTPLPGLNTLSGAFSAVAALPANSVFLS